MAFIILTMTFVLIFPTLGSAMTGYSGNVEAYIPDSNGNNILFSSFRPLYYILHDGDRVGLTKDYEVLAAQEDGKRTHMTQGQRLTVHYQEIPYWILCGIGPNAAGTAVT